MAVAVGLLAVAVALPLAPGVGGDVLWVVLLGAVGVGEGRRVHLLRPLLLLVRLFALEYFVGEPLLCHTKSGTLLPPFVSLLGLGPGAEGEEDLLLLVYVVGVWGALVPLAPAVFRVVP